MKTILVVEDDLGIARGLCDNLECEGYRALRENDGLKGYERARLERPDLVILDVMLPTMDGFQICTSLKREGFSAPIFLLTGLTEEHSRLKGLRHGADDYIDKPFNLQELLLRIRNVLRQREVVDDEVKQLQDEFFRARKIQMASLPRRHPRFQCLDVYGKTIPATQVGGDYFDYLNLGKRRLGIIVADVSGKGMPAAMHVQKIQGIVQSNAKTISGSAQMLRVLQEHMSGSMESSSFITAVVALFDLDAGTMEVAQAGHLPVLLIQKNKIRQLKPPGIWIGKTATPMFEKSLRVETVNLHRGDLILFFSDGLVEARNLQMTEFGLTRLKKMLAGMHFRRAAAVVERCLEEVKKFSGTESQSDDITVVAVKITAQRTNIKEKIP